VLFADNLSGHVKTQFRDALSKNNTKLHLLKARCTDELQVCFRVMQVMRSPLSVSLMLVLFVCSAY
jgi:hypothetical protein